VAEARRYFGSGSELKDNVGFSKLSYKTLAAIASGGVMSLRMTIAAAGHPDVIQKSPLSDEEAEIIVRANMAKRVGQGTTQGNTPSISGMFTRGKIVVHAPTGKKVTVIRASGEGRLEVIDKSGKKFLAKESNLKLTR